MSVRFSFRGPAWCTDADAFRRIYAATLAPLLQDVAAGLKADAQRAYIGTRFAAAFRYETQVSPAAVRLIQSDPLFPVVEYPTRAHAIRPRKPGGVLAWTQGGATVFARRVYHPGTRGRLAIDPLMAIYAREFERALTAAVMEAASRA